MEVQTHLMAKAIPKFIQIHMPLLPLKPMAQSRRGVAQILEAQTHPMTKAIPMPHPLIEPSVLRAAKALILEAQTHPMTKAIPRFIQMIIGIAFVGGCVCGFILYLISRII
jgi:hypothetical protein